MPTARTKKQTNNKVQIVRVVSVKPGIYIGEDGKQQKISEMNSNHLLNALGKLSNVLNAQRRAIRKELQSRNQ